MVISSIRGFPTKILGSFCEFSVKNRVYKYTLELLQFEWLYDILFPSKKQVFFSEKQTNTKMEEIL